MADIASQPELGLVEGHQSWTNTGPLTSHLQDAEIAALEVRAAATVAEPGTLGLWGLATGTWIAATVLGGFLPEGDAISVSLPVLFFAGITQFIAGLFAYRRANSLTASAFCSFGPVCLSRWASCSNRMPSSPWP